MFRVLKKKIIIDQDIKKKKINICNPTCIELPKWCTNRLGKYYLYYADHKGKFIKLACSNNLFGNWINVNKKIAPIADFKNAVNHIASPDIYIDNINKKIYLFTHSHSNEKIGQWTFLSVSSDGINFKQMSTKCLAPFYLRVFKFKNYFYGISKGGNLWRTKKITNKFKNHQNLFNKKLNKEFLHNKPGSIRHVGILIKKNKLYCFYTKIGDMPERIYYSWLSLSNNYKKWMLQKEHELLRPTREFEGKKLKLRPSKPGNSTLFENAVRDPYLFENNKKIYLFYSVKGEFGLAIAELKFYG